MAEEIVDKQKRSKGIPSYVCIFLLLYVASYIPVHVGLAWWHQHTIPSEYYRVLRPVYWPLAKLVRATGHRDDVEAATVWILNKLPRRESP